MPSLESHATIAEVSDDLTTIFTHLMKQSSLPMVEFAERYDLSITQLKLMFALVNAREPLSIGSLAQEAGASLPAAGRAIDSLVRDGLVAREEDPHDRRVKLVQTTRRGEGAIQKIYASRAETLRARLAKLEDDQLADLARAISPLRDSVERDRNPA